MVRESRLSAPHELVLDAVRDQVPVGAIAVALSGGADSAVAAWAAIQIRGRDAVRAIHVHHGQEASELLAEAARAIALSLGIAMRQIDVEVPDGASFEGQAREVRLAALAGDLSEDEWLVTGHHADDSAETVLANLLRGAGASGLAGIPGHRGRWVRPLLEVPASVIRDAASELQLPFADDPANEDPRHRRNVIRSELLPWLEDRFAVPVREVIGRSARLLAADDAQIEMAAEGVAIGRSAGAVTVAAVVLSTLPEPVAARVARRALRFAHPPYPGSAADVAAILRVARGESTREGLTGALLADRENALVAIYGHKPVAADAEPLVPDRAVTFGYWVVSTRLDPVTEPVPLGRYRVLVRADVVTVDPVIRGAAPGERIDLQEGSKPVRDAMREAGIPKRLRSAWPVVAVGGKIAWVAGARIASWARLESSADPAAELLIEGIEA